MFQNSAPDGDSRHDPARRRVLRGAALVLALATTKIRGVFADDPENTANGDYRATHLQQTMAQAAFRLFPHDGLATEKYQEIATALIILASTDKPLAEMLEAGVDTLDLGSPTPWLRRPGLEQLDGIRRIEGSEFFRLLRTTTIEHLYRDKAVWQILGYEGSSVEFGGYVDRGFDDIDWLPGENDRR